VFGDGDPDNGTEDDRSSLSAAGSESWRNAGGTIHCDGEQRGSGMLLALEGQLFLVTAAHVLMNLETAQPFNRCDYHHMAMHRLPGSQVALDLGQLVSGDFDAAEATDGQAFGNRDWAFLPLTEAGSSLVHFGSVPAMAWQDLAGEVNGLRLVAWDSEHRRMSVSAPCSAQPSTRGDLGGGAWPGQLLDDCDSGHGASGGGLLVQTAQGVFLIGIRTGSHWSPHRFPASAFPAGPPDGSPWDVQGNTNFARAVDRSMLELLSGLVRQAQVKVLSPATTAPAVSAVAAE
jgi:hypothetical protein